MADAGERVPTPLFLLEHMVVRLMLEFLRREFRFEMRAQERHAVQLIGVQTQPHPNEMQVIGHQAIRRAEQSLARGGVQQQFAEGGVKFFVQPAAPAVGDGQCPMNHGVALVILAWQAGQIKRPVQVRFVHGDGETVGTARRRIQPHRSSRRKEALIDSGGGSLSLLTSAATRLGLAAVVRDGVRRFRLRRLSAKA